MDDIYSISTSLDPNKEGSTMGFNIKEQYVKYTEKAKKKILELIMHKTGITNKKELTNYMTIVLEKTQFEMKKTYELRDPLINKNYFLESAPNDFIDWFSMISSITYYQSLGDTIGFKNGDWEFNNKDKNAGPEYTNTMLSEFIHLGGINKLSIVNWIASDDTILYLSTFSSLLRKIPNIQEYGERLRKSYLDNWNLMENRYPGDTTTRSIYILQNPEVKWDSLHYDVKAIGNGSCMRTGCIGIFYPGKSNRNKLIALAVESSRLTHNSATAILGSITTALFTAYAIERVPIAHWPHRLLKLLNSSKIDEYMKKSRPIDYGPFSRDKLFYIAQWQKYTNYRFAGASVTPRTDRKNMEDPVSRIKYFRDSYSKSHLNNPGGCADDACIIAFDSLLESGDNLEKLLVYSILHFGDSDTVGSIAFSWFGAYYFSKENYNLVSWRFDQLEFEKQIRERNIVALRKKLVRVYYYDLFINFAKKIIKKIPVKK